MGTTTNPFDLSDEQIRDMRAAFLAEASNRGYGSEARGVLNTVLPAAPDPVLATLTAEQIAAVKTAMVDAAADHGYSREAERIVAQVLPTA